MTKNIATSKERLLQYLELKGISKKDFYSKTEIKRGFLDTDKLKSNISDVFLANIIANFNDLNLYWLISGIGEMLLSIVKEINALENYTASEISVHIHNNKVDFDNNPVYQLLRESDIKDGVIELMTEKIKKQQQALNKEETS